MPCHFSHHDHVLIDISEMAATTTTPAVVVTSDSKDDADYVRGLEVERAAYVKGKAATSPSDTATSGWSAALPHYNTAAARGYGPAIVKLALAARYGFKARRVNHIEAKDLALKCIGTLADINTDIKSIKVPPPPGMVHNIGASSSVAIDMHH
jgi:hypothetical protein